MLDNPYKRKLAVIVSADVANYTRLTELNELEVHHHLRKRLNLVREYTEHHHGVVLRTHGDGCLCSFDSVINAFKATLELQQTSNLLNASLPNASQIRFRVGIHLSEVILDNDEPYGNGVNIAVRLQQSAKPGEIMVSADTTQFIPQKNAFSLSKSKPQKLKNISQKIYACRLIGHNISNNQPQQNSIVKNIAYVAFTLAIVALLFNANLEMTSKNDYQYVSEVLPNYNDVIIKSAQNSSDEEPELTQENSRINPLLENQLTIITAKVDHLNDEISSLRNKVNSRNTSIESKLRHVDKMLSMQEVMIDSLSRDTDQSHFVSVNAGHDYSNSIEYEHSDYLALSSDQITRSIDTIDTSEDSNTSKVTTIEENIFGCLSCAAKRSTPQYVEANINRQKNTAVVFGNISGDGAKSYLSNTDILRNYMSHKLQESIRQSAFSPQIEQFTHIEKGTPNEGDQNFIEQLCEKENNLLIAKYELMIGNWYTEGTHLQFYNCTNQKSVSYFEKQLAPTIHNVTKPYLTDDVLIEVNKSVDYMIDKLHSNRTNI